MKRFTAVILSLVLCAFVASAASAQANMGLRSVGFGVGVVDPEDIDMTVSFGFYSDWGTIRPNLHLETYLGYWRQTEGIPGFGEFFVSDFTAAARAKYVFDVINPTVKPFAGGGLGFHIVSAGIDVPSTDVSGYVIPGYSLDDTELKLGIDLGGGMIFDVSQSVAVQTEAWYSAVSDVSQLSLRAGLIFKLGG
jgi:opacity protein-like surface antigen